MQAETTIKALSGLKFDHRFTEQLPADPVTENSTRQVFKACYSWVDPTTVSNPELICYSPEMAATLGLTAEECLSEEFRQAFSGNQLLPAMKAYACCYGGHQFGHWAGQLGDGRAINLGEVLNKNNEHWSLQLKGAGPTPYSRTADGLAVLRSSVREFLCSEAMHHLGIPTTRALSLMLTGEEVWRDMFYDGNAELEPGAIVCRVAPSFTRFGSFEIFAARKDLQTLKTLLDFTIRTDFPHLIPLLEKDEREAYLSWFAEVVDKTVDLIVHWMRVGFVHGVMNTDNMSILGLTIDYGPYGWLDNFDPNWTPNTTDAQGRRYRYANQPAIAQWNLLQLANAIYPLIRSSKELEASLGQYQRYYQDRWDQMMHHKLGLTDKQKNDKQLIHSLETILENCQVDITLFYRNLAKLDNSFADNEVLFQFIEPTLYQPDALTNSQKQSLIDWLRLYEQRIQTDPSSPEERRLLMNKTNPLYILRNYLSQQAIDQSTNGDYSMIKDLLDTVRQPYDEQVERQSFATKRPDWAKQKPGCSMLSCSS